MLRIQSEIWHGARSANFENGGSKMYSQALNLLVISVIALTFSACRRYDKNPYTPAVQAFYEAPHGLRKMFNEEEKVITKTPAEGSMSGGFFLFMGGVSGSYKEGTTVEHSVSYVRFAWDVGNNTYAIANVPLDKVRIRITDKIQVPTVAFFLDENDLTKKFDEFTGHGIDYDVQVRSVERDSELRLLRNNYDAPEFLNGYMNYLKYVVISCNGSDWPQNITLPLNQ